MDTEQIVEYLMRYYTLEEILVECKLDERYLLMYLIDEGVLDVSDIRINTEETSY